jgi:MoaA/NifB/PqqE/SkfB family radical SAM enzyme
MSERSVEEQQERRWAQVRDQLVRLFRTYDPDRLGWILGHIAEELEWRSAGVGDDYYPRTDRYLRMARDVALTELGERELAREGHVIVRPGCDGAIGAARYAELRDRPRTRSSRRDGRLSTLPGKHERRLAVEIPALSSGESPLQLISIVADVIDNCNHACTYCHPMASGRWGGGMLSTGQVGDVLRAGEETGVLEVLLTGGEIAMHPEFGAIMEQTRGLARTAVAMVTNATLISQDVAAAIRGSGIARICVSLDGPDAAMHDPRRGRGKFARALDGLHALQETGKPITVISVLDRRTYPQILELSWMLAGQRLASQHHMCAPSYSGSARRSYAEYALTLPDYHQVQALVDDSYQSLLDAGLYVTFNSFWPATGEHGASGQPRTLTLSQAREQTKDLYVIVRSNGDVRSAAAAWGRETVGNAVLGNLANEPAAELLGRADAVFRAGTIRQLPREVEAGSKFQVGSYAGRQAADALISMRTAPVEELDLPVPTQPVRPLSELDLLARPFSDADLADVARRIAESPDRWRLVTHASGTFIAFDKVTSHATLLRSAEADALLSVHAACGNGHVAVARSASRW